MLFLLVVLLGTVLCRSRAAPRMVEGGGVAHHSWEAWGTANHIVVAAPWQLQHSLK